MEKYVSVEYYLQEFGGKNTENISRLLEKAQEKIDSITFNRIVAIGFNNLTDFQQEKIKKAVCYQAEYIFENGYNNEEKQDVSSYNVLDINISVKDKTINEKTQAERECMSEIAYDLVHKTGLDSRNFNGKYR